jgi:glyoxylase-like metal-dependent hydrolase (beta-lactamase superfamily II)
MKRILLGLLVVLLIPVIAVGAMLASAFAGNKEMVDGAELPGGARLIKDGYVAVFVLPAGDKEFALIDCGDDDKAAAILADLSRRGVGPESVKAIFLTHGHPDHIAGCHVFKGAKIYGFAADAPLADGSGRAKGLLPSMMSTPEAKRTKITDTLADGQTVEVGPLSVKVFSVPGHTAGSASYLANGTLFMGDNAGGKGDGSIKPAPGIFSDDSAQNERSLEALGKRLVSENDQVTMTAFAHSGPLDGADALKAFRAKQ